MSWANYSKIDQAERNILKEQVEIKNLVNNILSNQKPFLMQTTIAAREFEGINPGFKIDGESLIYSDHMIPVANKVDLLSSVDLIQNLDEPEGTIDTQNIHYDDITNCFFISCLSSNGERIPNQRFLIKVSAEDYTVIDKKEIPVFHSDVSKTFVWDRENIYLLTYELKFQAYRKSDLELLWEIDTVERNGFLATCDELDIVLFRDGSWSSANEIKAYNKSNGVEVWTNNSPTQKPYRIMDMVLTPEGKAILFGSNGNITGAKWCEWDTKVASPETLVFSNTSTPDMAYYSYTLSPDGKFAMGGRAESNYVTYFIPNYEGTSLYERAVGGLKYNSSMIARHITIPKNYAKEGGIIYFYNSNSKYWEIFPIYIDKDIDGNILEIKTSEKDYKLEVLSQRIFYGNSTTENLPNVLYPAREKGMHNGKLMLRANASTAPASRTGTYIVSDYKSFSHSASVFYKHIVNTKAPADLKIWAFVEADIDLNEGEAWYSFKYDNTKVSQEREIDEFGEKNYEDILYSGQRLVLSNRTFTKMVNQRVREVRINNALQSEILWINKIEIDGKLLFSEDWTFNRDNNRVVKFNKEIEQGSEIIIYYDLNFIEDYLPIYIHTQREEDSKIPPAINEIVLGYEI